MQVTQPVQQLSDDAQSMLGAKQFLVDLDKWISEHSAISARLCIEQKCTHQIAINWLKEVGKFLFICDKSNVRLTPSEKVDQGWHVLILFTQDYREFCQLFFGRFIDHYPGGEANQNKAQYERCLDALVQHFEYADKAFWPRGISISSTHISCGSCSN
jgi:hypothetical protein